MTRLIAVVKQVSPCEDQRRCLRGLMHDLWTEEIVQRWCKTRPRAHLTWRVQICTTNPCNIIDHSFALLKHAASRSETRNRHCWYLDQKCAVQALQGPLHKTRGCRESLSGNTCSEFQRHRLNFVLFGLFSKGI
jgi:hypothetical protein